MYKGEYKYGANSRKCMKISGFINGEDEEEMM